MKHTRLAFMGFVCADTFYLKNACSEEFSVHCPLEKGQNHVYELSPVSFKQFVQMNNPSRQKKKGGGEGNK